MHIGINNSSESDYIKSFAAYGLESGYRVIVHNHLGALKSEKLTAHRIFTYGKFSYSRSHNLIFNVVQSDNFFQSSETSLKRPPACIQRPSFQKHHFYRFEGSSIQRRPPPYKKTTFFRPIGGRCSISSYWTLKRNPLLSSIIVIVGLYATAHEHRLYSGCFHRVSLHLYTAPLIQIRIHL